MTRDEMVTAVVTSGVPGSIDDDQATAMMTRIVDAMWLKWEQRYDLLDMLWFFVANNHEHGRAANILNVISRKQYEVIP
jgi:hypothetical protein